MNEKNMNENIEKLKKEENKILESIKNKKIENKVQDIYSKILDEDINKVLNDYITNYEKQINFINNSIIQIENVYKEKELNLNNEKNIFNEKIENEYKLLEVEKSIIKKEHETFLENIKNKEKDLENEYISKISFLEDYQEELELDNQIKYNEMMNKLKKQKDEFNLFMVKQKDILKEEIEKQKILQNKEFEEITLKLDEKRNEIENAYNDKIKEYKTYELDILKKNTELNDKINDFNDKVKKFNIFKTKIIKRHYFSYIILNKFKKNKNKFFIGFFIIFSLLIYVNYLFEYSLNKNTFISNALSKHYNKHSYENTYFFNLDTSNSALKNIKDLDGLNLTLNFKHNEKYFEDLNLYTLNALDNNFKFERFYKNNTMIMKSANYGQYIILNDLKNSNYNYNKNEFNKNIYNSINQYLSTLKNKNYKNINRINILQKNKFLDYLKNSLFISSNYDYYYEIDKNSNTLFKNIFENLINSNNYKMFIDEESEIQNKLNLNNNILNSKDIIENMVKFSTVNNTLVNVKISKGNIINTIDINFDILYKDNSMVNGVPLKIKFSCNFQDLLNQETLEKDVFTKNAILIENLKPKKIYEEYKENKSIPFNENSTTVKELFK